MQPIYILGTLFYAVSAAAIGVLSLLIGSAVQRTVRESSRALAARLEELETKVARLEESTRRISASAVEAAPDRGAERRVRAFEMLDRGATAEIVSAGLGG